MKKTYINPETEVIIMKSECSLLAGSDLQLDIASGNMSSSDAEVHSLDDFDW